MGRQTCTEPQCLYNGALPSSTVVKKEYSYTSTPPMGRTACTEPQCLYNGALPSSTVVKKEYSYTCTPPMGRTACTEPQCLYKGALYLYLYSTPLETYLDVGVLK